MASLATFFFARGWPCGGEIYGAHAAQALLAFALKNVGVRRSTTAPYSLLLMRRESSAETWSGLTWFGAGK